MKHNFDQIINRYGTHCIKYDGISGLESDYKDILPLWIADMDFATPPFISEAIVKRLEHQVLGYTLAPEAYYEAIQDWFTLKYGFTPMREELEYTPGVVSAIYKLIACLTDKGDGVMIMPPIYPPFMSVINNSNRQVIEAPLQLVDGRQEVDWTRLEAGFQKSKILLLSHPHNPGGRVWNHAELERIADLAKEYNALVISDEIHADLTFKGQRHIPFPAVSPIAATVGITLMAPSKAFNMPGVIGSHFYIKNKDLRDKIFGYMEANGLGHAACYTYDAIIAAYTKGDNWNRQCIEYIEGNVRFVEDFLKIRIPKVKMIKPEASFLIFLDCKELNFNTPEELSQFFIRKAGLYLNEGTSFGTGGAFFMRLNIASPRSVIEEAMTRLEKAVNQLD